jgi:hypothetical protein
MLKWLGNPRNVALSLLIISTLLMVGGIVMECFTSVRSTHLLDELWGSSITLYATHMFAYRGDKKEPLSDNAQRRGPLGGQGDMTP